MKCDKDIHLPTDKGNAGGAGVVGTQKSPSRHWELGDFTSHNSAAKKEKKDRREEDD